MSDTPKKDDAGTGGGIGDIPAQPVDPASVGSGRSDPRADADGVHAHIPTEEGAEEAEAHPS